jgi:hypothetical protein
MEPDGCLRPEARFFRFKEVNLSIPAHEEVTTKQIIKRIEEAKHEH